jgi:hypothetical protein
VSALDEYSSDWRFDDDDELVRRLRTLEWAPVPNELRSRCWDDFSRRLSEQAPTPVEPATRQLGSRTRAGTNLGERYDFRRFAPARRIAVAQAGVGRYTPRTAFSVT